MFFTYGNHAFMVIILHLWVFVFSIRSSIDFYVEYLVNDQSSFQVYLDIQLG